MIKMIRFFQPSFILSNTDIQDVELVESLNMKHFLALLDIKVLYLVKSSPNYTSLYGHKEVIQLAVTKQSQLKSGEMASDHLMLNAT